MPDSSVIGSAIGWKDLSRCTRELRRYLSSLKSVSSHPSDPLVRVKCLFHFSGISFYLLGQALALEFREAREGGRKESSGTRSKNEQESTHPRILQKTSWSQMKHMYTQKKALNYEAPSISLGSTQTCKVNMMFR